MPSDKAPPAEPETAAEAGTDELRVVPMPQPKIGPLDQRLQALTTLSSQEAMDELSAQIGRMTVQRLADQVAIRRLVAHIRKIDPDDQVAAAVEQQQQEVPPDAH